MVEVDVARQLLCLLGQELGHTVAALPAVPLQGLP